ncbi:MAG: hypothetical protein IT578_09930 [Verrucomicrobiae bacterium]|nr:hypothetical protein [Verrucomicrobiae bacterium]
MKTLRYILIVISLLFPAWVSAADAVDPDWDQLHRAMNNKDYANAESIATVIFDQANASRIVKLSVGNLWVRALEGQGKPAAEAREKILAVISEGLAQETSVSERCTLLAEQIRHRTALGKTSKEEMAKTRRELIALYAKRAENADMQQRALMLYAKLSQMSMLKESTVAEEDAILAITEPVGDVMVHTAIYRAERLRSEGKFAEAAQLLVDKMAQAASPAALRKARNQLNGLAGTLNRMLLAKQGKSFVGPGKLALAQALVDAENSGRGLEDALAALGLKVPGTWADQRAAIVAERDAVLAGTKDLNPALATRIEWFLGIAGAKEFEQRYNQGSASVK